MSECVVITGGSSGIGQALAHEYLARGAKVAVIDLHGDTPYRCDVTDEAALNETADRIAREVGRPTVWVNNAGIAALGAFDDVSSADFDRVLRVNFGGVVYGTRTALRLMREPERGTIVNIASVSGHMPAPYLSSYTASKHAVVGYTRALRLEKKHAQSAIRIVLVSPGFIRTAIMQGHKDYSFPQWLEWMIDDPASAAREMVRGIERGDEELVPTRNGRFISRLYKLAPTLARTSTRLIAAKDWKQILGLDPIRKD